MAVWFNQTANYVVAQTEIDIPIGNMEPPVYFSQLLEQCNGSDSHYGNVTDPHELRENLAMSCIPDGIEKRALKTTPCVLDRKVFADG